MLFRSALEEGNTTEVALLLSNGLDPNTEVQPFWGFSVYFSDFGVSCFSGTFVL